MALIISEYDFWKGRLSSHFFRTQRECRVTDELTQAAEELANANWMPCRRNGVKAETKGMDRRVALSYLDARKRFEQINVLRKTAAVCSKSDVFGPSVESQKTVDPSPLDFVMVSEKASVFTMGLIMTELFGGKRTGLTSLTRLRAITDLFLNETGNAEFRMVLEWETPNALLETPGLIPSNRVSPQGSTRCCSSNVATTSSDTSNGKMANTTTASDSDTNLSSGSTDQTMGEPITTIWRANTIRA